MPNFFPRHTLELHIVEPKAFRRISFSLAEMAVVTGVLVRVYRVVVLTHGPTNWLFIGLTVALGAVFLLGMLTAHLANFPLSQYLWRAPLFAMVEVGAEMLTSALLIALGREANGTVRAHWDDWIGMGLNALLIRGLAIMLWTALLAGAIQIARRTMGEEEEGKGAELQEEQT
jgi:hypothetical protein